MITYAKLRKKNQQLKALIVRLEQLVEKFPCWYAPEFCGKSDIPDGGVLYEVAKVLNESPQQSLAEIQDDAVEAYKRAMKKQTRKVRHITQVDTIFNAVPETIIDTEYANQLRNPEQEKV